MSGFSVAIIDPFISSAWHSQANSPCRRHDIRAQGRGQGIAEIGPA